MDIVVDIAGMRVSNQPQDTLVTYALGSCLGISIHDSVSGVGGMIHIMLPQSKIDPVKAEKNPYMFVDTGVPELFKAAYALGATKGNITLKVAGGAKIMDPQNRFKIGERNFSMLRKLLWKNEVLIANQEVGGSDSRTMRLDVGSGKVTIRSKQNIEEL